MIKMCLFDRSINGMIVNALKQLLNRKDREKVFADILGHARGTCPAVDILNATRNAAMRLRRRHFAAYFLMATIGNRLCV